MEQRINRFGIIDFFTAFTSDTSVDSGKIKMSDLKAKDWDVVTESVKKELLIGSPKRIQEIYKSILTKINHKVLNVRASTKGTTKGKDVSQVVSRESESREI